MAWLRALLIVVVMGSTAFARDGVNAVIGDDSWVARFGVVPDASADEDARLRVHLEYVEAMLRARVPDGLSEAQRAARAHNLDLLHAYVERGAFPRNHEVAGRRPHFIDDDGRICAVGYLIEQTAGRAAAEAINAAHEWDYIPEIRGIEAWVAASGLTVEELATIQPGYSWRPRPVPPPPIDERAIQRRIIVAALASAQVGVQRCAERFEMWSDRVDVSVTVGRGGVFASVPRVGSRGFRRCVANVVESTVASRVMRGRVWPMSVSYSFALAIDDDDVEWSEPGFAQPPPR